MCDFKRLNSLCVVIVFMLIVKTFSVQHAYGQEEMPYLKNVVINGDSVIVALADGIERELFYLQELKLSYRYNNIAFELTPSGIFQYQYFLQGFDTQWSRWKQNNIKEYTNLPAGQYLFKARYRDSDNYIGEMPVFTFKVLPLWYFSRLAIIFFIILFILTINGLYDLFNLRFARKQYSLEQIINARTEDLIIEKEKTEALLANVLPKNTADEIIAKGKATRIRYSCVTVLFSDIQGFTEIAEEMNPEVLIDELDKFFFYFDSVVERHGIEKIKTIGDAYMCAGGIPEKNRSNPVEVILAALEMKAYMKTMKETLEPDGMRNWDIRIGIHTGSVVAGVVGQKKLSYDIWGDTVNIASRMESAGEAGKINISGTTHEFVKDFFDCEFRGKMPVKYKGDLEMYFVNGIIPDLRNKNGGPNGKFIIKMQMIKLQDIEEMIIKLYSEEASPNLFFHNSVVVRNISNRVEKLSKTENLPDGDYINLKLASVFLLTGYLSDYEKPMEASSRLVEEILPRFGFDQVNVELTKKLIRNSFVNFQESLSDNILHDAVYDYLGHSDYIMLTGDLLRERQEYGKYSDKKKWIEIQKKLLSDHEFITESARVLRSVSVEDQIAALRCYDE